MPIQSFFREHLPVIVPGVGSSLSIAALQANGSLDLPATLVALTGLVTAFAIALVKIWGVIMGVHVQLKDIANEANERRKAAETELESLRGEVARLRDEIEALRDQLEAREDEHEESVRELELAVETAESKLITVTLERDQYRELWEQSREEAS